MPCRPQPASDPLGRFEPAHTCNDRTRAAAFLGLEWCSRTSILAVGEPEKGRGPDTEVEANPPDDAGENHCHASILGNSVMIGILYPTCVYMLLQENLNYDGAAILHDFLQKQMQAFNQRLASLQKESNRKHSLDEVKRFEMDAHEKGWAELTQQIRVEYKSKRVDPSSISFLPLILPQFLLKADTWQICCQHVCMSLLAND